MNKNKRLLCLCFVVLFLLQLICGFTAFSATDEHVNMIFNQIAADETFMPALYQAGQKFTTSGVTNDYIDTQIKRIIRRSINEVVELQKTAGLTSATFSTQMKKIIENIYLTSDSVVIALFFEAFPDILEKQKLSESMKPLSDAIMQKVKTLLFTDNIADTLDYKFLDIDDYAWAREAILTLADNGVIDGIDICRFAPGNHITREQFVKLLAVICALDLENTKSVFSDVPADSWYYPYVSAMADAGYVMGLGDGMFGSGQYITREDMAVLLFRIGQKTLDFTEKEDSLAFVDDSKISAYATAAVYSLREYGIINGTPENNFNPSNFATRAEGAQMLYKFYKLIHS